MFRMNKKLVNMKAIAREFILDNKLNQYVVFSVNTSATHTLKKQGEMSPYSASCVYMITELGGNITIREFESCDRISLSMNTISMIAKELKRDPEEYLLEVLEYIKHRVMRYEDPSWRAISIINGIKVA